ncbi:hypothetical protein [Nonomuraea sp. NPDC048916]|uniref:hypothetical protein n=1 Tax=Nonomuraea sp. NPDC048916 TaxID=3154232 RepID=UPI0034055E3F
MDWKLVLEYIRVLIWPTLIFLVALVFKGSLGQLIGRITKAGAAGVELEFDRAEEAIRQAEEVIGQISEGYSAAQQATDKPLNASGDGSSHDDEQRAQTLVRSRSYATGVSSEQVTRHAIEAVLAQGARIGWEWARKGEEEPPRLEIFWTLSGYPQVKPRRFWEVLKPSTERDYESQINGALNRIVHSGYIRREVRMDKSMLDFALETDDGLIAIETLVSINRRTLIEQLRRRFEDVSESDANMAGFVIVAQEMPSSGIIAYMETLWSRDELKKVDIVHWSDKSDDHTLLQVLHGFAPSIPPF